MRFRKKSYLRKITSKGRHNYNKKCNPNVVEKCIDANTAYDLRKPDPHKRNG